MMMWYSTALVRFWTIMVVAAALGLLGAQTTAAIETRDGEVVTIPSGTVINDDLFAAGRTVNIAGDVTGDVFAFGSTVTVSGTVGGDLIAAGQQLSIDGTVRGDTRAAGQAITVNGRVDGNATLGAEKVTLGNTGAIGGN